MKKLTKKQREVYSALKEYFQLYSKSPTLEELGELVGISSRSGVYTHLKTLEKKGLISRNSKNRGITLKEKLNFSLIPILGYANAGQPLVQAEEENLGQIKVDSRLLNGSSSDLFGVIVKGDSMNMANIQGEKLEPGKIAIVDKSTDAKDNDIVLAVIDESATIKKMEKKSSYIILKPVSNNERHQPIYIKSDEDLFINGKIVMALEK